MGGFDFLSGWLEGPKLLGALVFLATTTLAFTIMAMARVRGAVKKRAASVSFDYGAAAPGGARTLGHSGMAAAQKLIEYTTKYYAVNGEKETRVLRARLIRAGYFEPRAVGYFFLTRAVLAVSLAGGAFFILPLLGMSTHSTYWMLVGLGGIIGYLGPSLYLDKRIAARKQEYVSGFPDFMDLLVVCADAGLAMEGALERVGRELGASYPALCANIHMTNLEVRAGKRMTEALEGLAERLGLDEARSFATLIQQSEELGSSVTEALRVYSDDMRHKRLSKAEEKAYSLPAKLALPMMLCIFPVLFVVILLPVVVRLYYGNY